MWHVPTRSRRLSREGNSLMIDNLIMFMLRFTEKRFNLYTYTQLINYTTHYKYIEKVGKLSGEYQFYSGYRWRKGHYPL